MYFTTLLFICTYFSYLTPFQNNNIEKNAIVTYNMGKYISNTKNSHKGGGNVLYVSGANFVDKLPEQVEQTKKAEKSNENTSVNNDQTFAQALEEETSKTRTMTIDEIFKEASERYGVPENLLRAIGWTESGFQPNAVSSSGAMGIMQLMPSTAKTYGVQNPFDPYENIMCGAAVFKTLSDMYNGDISLALAAYNVGYGTVNKYGGMPPIDSVQKHVQKVLNLMENGVPSATQTVEVDQSEINSTQNIQTDEHAKILQQLQDILSIMYNRELQSTNDSSTNSLTNLITGQTTSTLTANPLLSAYPASTQNFGNLLISLQNIDTSDTNSLRQLLDYAQYEFLMSHYNSMLDIIATLGTSTVQESEDQSLTNLFQLSNAQNAYKQKNVNALGGVTYTKTFL